MSRLTQLLEKNKFIGKFGIDYLDRKVSGILPNDLILIGARSGAGKSSLALMIASHNSRQKVPVSLISLENFEGDDFMTKAYYAYVRLSGDYNLTQREFLGGYGTCFYPDMELLKQAEAEAEKFFENIKLTSRKKGFGLSQLKDTMIRNVEHDGCRLIVLDHIDYLDKADPSESDLTHIAEIMRTIRELQEVFGVAVVAVSHLRKASGGKDTPKIPSLDEFIGSGNKVKESTMVIVFAPDDNRNETSVDRTLRSTFCCIRKLRLGGYDNTCARLQFDTRSGVYRNEYDLCTVNYAGTEVTAA